MAWMLEYLMVLGPIKLAAPLAKAAGGFLLKRLWVMIVGEQSGCHTKGCMRPSAAKMHGLCMTCYGKAKKKVDSDEVTWERLTELGLCRSEAADPFDDAYSRAMKGD